MSTEITPQEIPNIKIKKELSSLVIWFLLTLLALVWGSSFILMKKSLEVFSSLQVGAIRIFSAFLFFLPVLISKKASIPSGKWIYFALTGFLGVFFPAFLFTIAGKELQSSISGALNSLTPLCTLIVGALFFHKEIQKQKIFGIILGLIGSSFLIFSNLRENLTINAYAFLVLGATVMYGFNLNIVKKQLNDVPALIVTACLLAVIGPLAGVMLFSTDIFEKINQPNAIGPLLYAILLGVLSTGLATVLFNYILQRTTPVFASSVTYLIPIFAFMWGFIDGEIITLQHFVGMAIILVGVYLVNKN